jgi:L-rhamnose isomerase/sugar isomerase
MKIYKNQIGEYNALHQKEHQRQFDFLAETLANQKIDVEKVVQRLIDFQIAIPSWALGTGGTRFGRFVGGGEPRNLEEKIEDIGLLHSLNASSGAISLHIPWDIPENADFIKSYANSFGIAFDSVNSNTFQDQKNQLHSYKFGSLSHTSKATRQQAIEHTIEVIKQGEALGSKAITVWLADGSCFPAQQDFRKALQHTLASLQEIYVHLPADWQLFIEYKPYEPNFYSTVIQDWGTSFLLVNKLGHQAFTLVDLGHHLPNTNIEQIVATLMMEGKLGGFHFNDSKYGDDDLTVGCMKPYQLFLIFNELVAGMEDKNTKNPYPAWMIDASHNVKDPLEDLLQSMEAIKIAYAQALLVNRAELSDIQECNDAVKAQEVMQNVFRTDVRPLLAEARKRANAALSPLELFRNLKVREKLVEDRGKSTLATGL